MDYLRPLFGGMALTLCLLLGVFALFQKPLTRVNLLFAFYNFSNAIYNAADFCFLMPSQATALWYVRIADSAAALVLPFLLHFAYEIFGFSKTPRAKRIIVFTYCVGVYFMAAHYSPWMVVSVQHIPHVYVPRFEVLGPLYWVFMAWMITTLIAAFSPLPRVYKESSGLKKKQAAYLMVACLFGGGALMAYSFTFVGLDMPYVHYTLQMAVGLVFAYAIFEHRLISVRVAFYRAYLLVGLYSLSGLLLLPGYYFLFRFQEGSPTMGVLLIVAVAGGVLFSGSAFVFYWVIGRHQLFQEKNISHLTHEFKSPLAAMQSARLILEEEFSRPKPDGVLITSYLQMLARNEVRLEGFVRDILKLTSARRPDDPTRLKPQSIDLNLLISEIAANFPSLQGRFQLSVVGNATLNANREGLVQIFENLIANAVKFSHTGEIRAKISGNETHIEFTLQDHGVGIAANLLPNIFDPYVKSNTGNNQGSGLGLSIVKGWVDSHNGKIWVESAGVGKGALFTVVLPRG